MFSCCDPLSEQLLIRHNPYNTFMCNCIILDKSPKPPKKKKHQHETRRDLSQPLPTISDIHNRNTKMKCVITRWKGGPGLWASKRQQECAHRNGHLGDRAMENELTRDTASRKCAVSTVAILNRQKVFHGLHGNFVDIIKQSCIREATWLYCPFLLKRFYETIQVKRNNT